MNRKERQALAQQAAKGIKTEKGLCDFSAMLRKITVEAALNTGLNDPPGYEQPSDNTNRRNGYSSKTLLTDDGTFDVDVPRDRDAQGDVRRGCLTQPDFQGDQRGHWAGDRMAVAAT